MVRIQQFRKKIDSDFLIWCQWPRREAQHCGCCLGWSVTNLTPNMKKRKYYRIAEKRFPQEKDRKLLAILAEGIRIGGEEEPTKEEMGF